MNQNIRRYILLLPLMLALLSCEQFRSVSGTEEMVPPLSATIKVNLNLGTAPLPDQLQVKLVNFAERYELTTTMTPNQPVTVENIIPGIYTITVSAEKSEDGFTYNYNGNVVNVGGIVDNQETITVDVGAAKAGALLFKEVYYSGSRTPPPEEPTFETSSTRSTTTATSSRIYGDSPLP